MSYILRHGIREIPLGTGRFLIGRSETCQLCLDDPLTSRNHAAIVVDDAGAVAVEDLQSRNGVFVSGQRVEGRRELNHGDVVRIGGQELTLLKRTTRAETLQRPITQRMEAFGVLGALADKALAMGNGLEAERIIARQLDQLLREAEAGTELESPVFEKFVFYASQLLLTTRKARWLDTLLRIHAVKRQLLPAELVNELYTHGRKLTGFSPQTLRDYVAHLRMNLADLNPSERFILGRIEGLEALML